MNRSNVIKYFIKQQFKPNGDNGQIFLSPKKELERAKSKYKWETLVHNGMKFPEEYQQKNVPIIYEGNEILLNKEAEEYAFLYAKYLDTDYTKISTFNKNFFNDWKKLLGKDSPIKSLELCDFSSMKKYLKEEKEKKKQLQTEKKTESDDKYKIAYIDNQSQEVANYKIEPPGIFLGRGKNPHMGKIKRRLYPEDITINIGKDAPIPEIQKELEDHHWGKIIHDRTVEWLCSWKDPVTGKTKYLFTSQSSPIKTSGDQKKFDLARKLKKKIKRIREENEKNMKNSDIKMKQIATALYFIDKLAIRVGNETSVTDETDVVGVTTLRVEHIELGENNKITLNFLGKDQVPYTNSVIADPIVYNNIKEFILNKDKYDQIFDKINSNDINKYLQGFMKDLSAKVFRTYNASNMFQKELNKITKKYEHSTEPEEIKQKIILDEYAKANAKVAKILNHQKNVSKGYKKQVDKINDTITMFKKKLTKLRRKKRKSPEAIKKIKEKIKNYKSKKELVKEMKNISLNTSKANYIDPRIGTAFFKKHNLDVNKIFSKTLQKKFEWAFAMDENYQF